MAFFYFPRMGINQPQMFAAFVTQVCTDKNRKSVLISAKISGLLLLSEGVVVTEMSSTTICLSRLLQRIDPNWTGPRHIAVLLRYPQVVIVSRINFCVVYVLEFRF